VIRVLVADDHPVVRQGLCALLESLDGFEVVAVASNGRAAVREAVIHRPDVALLDLQMPDLDGFAAIRELATAAPDVAVCVLTMFDDDDSLFTAMQAGARGYLLKGAEQEDIARAIQAVARGEVLFAPEVAGRVLGRLSGPVERRGSPFPQLTPRELEILDLLATGRPTADIAQRLGLSVKTVGNNVSSILAKLGLTDRVQAAVVARDAGLGRGDL
jgi:DNA-binding NarL/FixJ family response regulator